MPKYLIKGCYTGDGIAGLRKDGGTGRRQAVKEAAEAAGGTLESMYYAFGDTDVYCVLDLPDNTSAAGLALLVGSAGAVDITTTVLLTPEEMDAATHAKGSYRPPGV